VSELDPSAETEAAAEVERAPLAVAEAIPADAVLAKAVLAKAMPPPLEPGIAALCLPISQADPCGPDLDSAGDSDYLNFLAQVEGILPTSFFSLEDGKPFDPSTIDLLGYLAEANKLLARSRDLRLLMIRARLLILNRDLAGFAVTLGAVAECLDRFWDAVHPRPEGDDLSARRGTIAALDLPTVIFPLQYAPLFEARRTGSVTYRSWIVATGEVKSRPGDVVVSAAFISEAVTTSDPASLAPARKHLALLETSVQRIGRAFESHGDAADLDNFSAQLRKMRAFVDPDAASGADALTQQPAQGDPSQSAGAGTLPDAKAASLTSINDAKQALAAIAEYYTHSEPSSPALPLVRQAHQLIGKSFLEIMTVLVPTHVDKAAFQIGTNPVFDLPVSKLSFLAANPADLDVSALDNLAPAGAARPADSDTPAHRVASRAQALGLLDSIQRYFRHAEPSSPVPMLCERARALAERDFMGVLEDVLPKSALKVLNNER
jgi:type VI secretion system protein ImpA